MQIDLRLLENLPEHVYVFAVILGVLTAAFVLFFIVPSFVVSWRLGRVTKRVRGMEGRTPAEIGEVFGQKGVLAHLWREYSHTLHAQEIKPGSDPQSGEPGSDPLLVRYRSTVPAEALFRPEIVVDTPLKSEFFRHLPGLFTGVGIIGTFFGLLIGLRAFQVSENPVIVRDSLNNLLHGVYEAFLVSAVAIALAMLVTLIERLVIARLYAKVEKLVQTLDALFEAGAGEEYLARLVKATEASADRSVVLKDALASELRAALREIGERQIAATNALGERLGTSIEAGLRQPLLEVAEGLRGLRTEQWGAVQGMLDHVMSGHTQKLQGLFGEQVSGIHALEAKTIDTLNTAVSKLEQMAMNVESAGTRGASAMSDRLGEALAAAESRQRAMNDAMAGFLEQMRDVVARSQGETGVRLQHTLDELSTRMRDVIEQLRDQVRQTTETSRQHHEELAAQTSRMVSEVGGQVSGIVDGVNRAIGQMNLTVDQMASNLEAAGTRGASAMTGQLEQALAAAESRQRAMNDTTTDFVQQIRTSVAQSHDETQDRLRATLDQLSARMNEVTEGLNRQVQQTTEASRQHHEALAAQTSRMVGEVGGQVASIVDGMNRATGEMKSAVEQMASNLEAAGTRGVSAMSGQLEQALAAAETRQRAVNDTTTEFVQQIRTAVAQSQDETHAKLRGTLDELSVRMNEVTESLNRQVQQTTETSRQHHEALAEQTSRMVGEVGGQVGAMVDGVNRASSEMKAAVDTLQRSTNDALVALNMGASTVSSAASDFAKAGEAVSGAIEKSDVVAERLAQAAQSVAGVSRGLTSVVADYEGARAAIAQLVESLSGIVDQAKRETVVTEEVAARIERATTALADAHREAGEYLARVSEVLGEAHGAFSHGVRQTLEDVNKDFHRQLSESVKLLRIGIQELQASVESISR